MGRAAAGIPRAQADALVRQLVVKYQPELTTRPVGKSFTEVYDLTTLKPTSEWLGVYEEVKAELRGMGLKV